MWIDEQVEEVYEQITDDSIYDPDEQAWQIAGVILPVESRDWANLLRTVDFAEAAWLLWLRRTTCGAPIVEELRYRVRNVIADRVEEMWESEHGSDYPPTPTGLESVVCIPCEKGVGHVWHDDGRPNSEES